VKITIDTDVDSISDALAAVYTAYGRSPEQAIVSPVDGDLHDVVWITTYGGEPFAWTRAMVRNWARRLETAHTREMVWRICAEPGLPVPNLEIAAYIVPDAKSRREGWTALAQAVRDASRIGREIGSGMPIAHDRRHHTRTADPAVAALVTQELKAHPRYREMAHLRNAVNIHAL
jgi:hypothetical protein